MSDPLFPPHRYLVSNLIFVMGAFLVRCAGCIWNDIGHQDLDRKISRTRNRPMDRNAISTTRAPIFNLVQLAAGLYLVGLFYTTPCVYYRIPSMLLTAFYPFARRFTYNSQLVLGCEFSWRAIMAFPAMELDFWDWRKIIFAAGHLFVFCIAWTRFSIPFMPRKMSKTRSK